MVQLDNNAMNNAPDRIYGWQHNQLSIARHYGGCSYNGAEYAIAYNEEGQPLVRIDLIKDLAKSDKATRKTAALKVKKAQTGLPF